MKKKVFVFFWLIIIGYLAYYFINNIYQIKNLSYGAKANSLRLTLKIPIIGDDMVAKSRYDEYFGNRWENNVEIPGINKTLHVWKNVTPSEIENEILSKESDAFRRLDSKGKVIQFNIHSRIVGDTSSIREGLIFYLEPPRNEMRLSETQIDSIAKLWNLDYLIKNKIKN